MTPKKPPPQIKKQPTCLTPSVVVLCKLGSIAVHADEMLSDDGHAFDRTELQARLVDPEVVAWIAAMRKFALVPVKRTPAQPAPTRERRKR